MDLLQNKEQQEQINAPKNIEEETQNKLKILDLNEAPGDQEGHFDEILKSNFILQQDIDTVTEELKELEAKISAEYDTLTASSTYKEMAKRANRIRKLNSDAIVKDGATMATIRCHELLSNTKSAIKSYLTQLSQGQFNKRQWKDAQRLLKEGSKVETDVKSELARLTFMENKSAEEKASGNQNINDLCAQLLRHSSIGNSSYFKRIIKAIKKFQELPAGEKTAEATDALYDALNTYIDIRSEGGTKTRFKMPAGAERLKLAQQLKASLVSTYYISSKSFADTVQESGTVIKELSIDKVSENITKRVDQIAGISLPEVYDSIQIASSRYEEMANLTIYKYMLKPKYVRSHKADFQKYINLINTTKKYLEEDESNPNETDLFARYIRGEARSRVSNYKNLENYVKLCLDDNVDDEALSDARSNIYSFKGDPKNKSASITFGTRHHEKEKCKAIMFAAIRKMGPFNEVSADITRFQVLINPWKMNEKGEPATPKDMEIYKENLRYFSTLLLGNKEEYLVAAKEIFERMINKDFFTKKDMDKSTWESNPFLEERSSKWLNTQNILDAWKNIDLSSEFSKMFPELADKISSYSDFATSLNSASSYVFKTLVGNQIDGNSFNKEDSKYELDEEDIKEINEAYAEAQVNFKKLEKKYGNIFK